MVSNSEIETDVDPDGEADLPAAIEGGEYAIDDLPDPWNFEFGNTKLEPQYFETVPAILENGGTKQMTASVSYRTLLRWFKEGERNVESEEPLDRFGAFYLYCRRGIESYQARALSSIQNEKWKLERLYPDEFGKKEKTVVESPRPKPQDIDVTDEDRAFLKYMFGGGE